MQIGFIYDSQINLGILEKYLYIQLVDIRVRDVGRYVVNEVGKAQANARTCLHAADN